MSRDGSNIVVKAQWLLIAERPSEIGKSRATQNLKQRAVRDYFTGIPHEKLCTATHLKHFFNSVLQSFLKCELLQHCVHRYIVHELSSIYLFISREQTTEMNFHNKCKGQIIQK